MATIDPGAVTLYHRHRVNTLYVVLSGGLSRSEEPGNQKQHTVLGASLRLGTKLAWALRRKILGTLNLSTGALIMQYHRDFPLTHRLHAVHLNPKPIRMLGPEVPDFTSGQLEGTTAWPNQVPCGGWSTRTASN